MFIDTKEIKIQLDISQLDYDKITDAIIDTIKEKSSDELLDRVFSNLWYKTEEKLYNLIAEHMSDILTKKYGFSIMENAYNGSYNKKLMIYDYEKYRYNPNLNKDRISSSKKKKNEQMNFKGLYNKRNKSFCFDNNSGNNSFDSVGGWDGNLVNENEKKIKRKELNSALNEKNKKRQKFLDKINS